MVIITKLVSKYKEINTLFYSCLAGIIFLVIFSFVPFIYVKISALVIQAICFASIFPLTTSISAKRDIENSGTILGFTIAFAFAGSIVFQPIYGYVTEYFGKQYIVYITLVGALMGFVFISILFLMVKDLSRRSADRSRI